MRLWAVMGVVAWVAFAAGFVCAILFVTWAEKLK